MAIARCGNTPFSYVAASDVRLGLVEQADVTIGDEALESGLRGDVGAISAAQLHPGTIVTGYIKSFMASLSLRACSIPFGRKSFSLGHATVHHAISQSPGPLQGQQTGRGHRGFERASQLW